MKKYAFLIILLILTTTSVVYLYKSEKSVQGNLKKNWPSLARTLENIDGKFKGLRMDLRWAFPLLLLIFLLIEFMPSQNYKKSPGIPHYLLAVFVLGVGLTLALILFIYNLPQDKTVMAGVVIDRGARDTFLSTILHYSILIGNGHFFALLLVSFWIEASKRPIKKVEEE